MMSFKWWYHFQMNRITVGPPTRLSKFESRELRAPLYVYCRYVMTRQGRFTVKRRYEVDTNEHGVSVVPATHGRARSQPFSIDKYKSSETNIIHTFSDHFNFQVGFHPLYHILAFRDWCQSTFCNFCTNSEVSDICCKHCSKTSTYWRNQGNRVWT